MKQKTVVWHGHCFHCTCACFKVVMCFKGHHRIVGVLLHPRSTQRLLFAPGILDVLA